MCLVEERTESAQEAISKQGGGANSRATWETSTGDKIENRQIGAKEKIQI